MVQRIYHIKLWGRTGEGTNHDFPFYFIASFSIEESCGVLEGCCCRLRWVSASSGYCNRSSLIEPGWGRTSLYTFGSMTSQGELRDLYRVCYPHKMEPLPFKMAAFENKTDVASGFPCDRATGPTVSLAANSGAEPGYYETRIKENK